MFYVVDYVVAPRLSSHVNKNADLNNFFEILNSLKDVDVEKGYL